MFEGWSYTQVFGALAAVAAALWALRWAYGKLGRELGFTHRTSTKNRGLRVLITGSSRGIGLALATRFVELGDKVCIVGRDRDALARAEAGLSKAAGSAVCTAVADVASSEDVRAMMKTATDAMGGVDIVVHNAGAAQSVNKPLPETAVEDIEAVIRTNCVGTLLVAREAVTTLAASGGGHLFLMDGAGSNGMTTPSFATYGFSKAGIPQLVRTLNKENAGRGVVAHGLSPGMVMTSLLLRAPTKRSLWAFNVLAEMPSTVAAWLVPRIRGAAVLPVPHGSEGRLSTYPKFLTTTTAALRFLSVVLGRTKNRLVDTTTGVVKRPEFGCPALVDIAEPEPAKAKREKH